MGWFGFNGGSQLAAGTIEDVSSVATIYINTNLAAGGGVITAAIISRLIGGKTDVVMMLNGAIAGLVAITAEPLTPSPLAAIFIGGIGGLVMYFSTKLLFKLKIDDDVVGAIPAHLVAGVWGTLAVPLTNGDVSFGAQFLGTISVVVFVFIVSFIVFKIMKATVGLRISKEAERLGTDKAEIGVIAYGIRD
jgi:Amt family ammonium transporter